jgi:hypothetical protein
MSKAGTLSDFTIRVTDINTIDGSTTITLLKNDIATNISLQVNTGVVNTTLSDLDTVVFNKGDLFRIEADCSTGTTGQFYYSISFVYK